MGDSGPLWAKVDETAPGERPLSPALVAGIDAAVAAGSVPEWTYLLRFPDIDARLVKVGRSADPSARRAYYAYALRTRVITDCVLPHWIWERVIIARSQHLAAEDNGFEVRVCGASEFFVDDGTVVGFFHQMAGATWQDGEALQRRFLQQWCAHE